MTPAAVHLGFRRGVPSLHEALVMPRYSLETIILILVILWLLGAFVAPFGGNLIHLLLVVVLIVVVLRLLRGGRSIG